MVYFGQLYIYMEPIKSNHLPNPSPPLDLAEIKSQPCKLKKITESTAVSSSSTISLPLRCSYRNNLCSKRNNRRLTAPSVLINCSLQKRVAKNMLSVTCNLQKTCS
ncbi:hypothetical protein Hanom_Chr00s000006g01612911 [Helianthus anomalus]